MLAWTYNAPLFFKGTKEVTFRALHGSAVIEIDGYVTRDEFAGTSFGAYAGDVQVNGIYLEAIGMHKAAAKLAARINDADYGDTIDNSI